MGRQHLWRKVSYIPPVTYFKPFGIPASRLVETVLLIEEAEAIRLKDCERLEQEECARKMSISRTTFSRILDSARQKIASALLNGNAIRIEGGNYEMAERRFRCISGHEWDVPFEEMIASPPEFCPQCDTLSIMPIFPPNVELTYGHSRNRYRRGR
ncbi:MAG: DUF134 domain-containing protein [Dehalococcoidales bacterium]|nr:DUF134 domain-containing protein [Dehalococcoidales bacterium]